MLRSLYSGISGLKAHQAMIDVTGNNIANVNTVGFKSSSAQFQDTLSQMVKGSSGGTGTEGGTNPAQIGLGVQVAGITTNFSQGSAQFTGKATDMMISGDGFFVTSKGGQSLYTRAGAFGLDARGNLTSADGGIVQGWATGPNGEIAAGGAPQNIVLSSQIVSPAKASTSVTMGGNLPSDAEDGAELVRDIEVYDASGTARTVSLTFTKTAAGWDVAGKDSAGATAAAAPLTFTDGVLDGTPALTVGGVGVELAGMSGFADMSTVAAKSQNGNAAGTLDSFALSPDGTLVGSFSNGVKSAVAKLAMATFSNPAGLEKVGSNGYVPSTNSGEATIGSAGTAGMGTMSAGVLEMSNVDLSQEFTNLIIAQRGFQANSRIITTSDELLQEIVSLKR